MSAKYSFHPFGYLHIRVNSCTGRSLLSPFLSSLKLILGNSFQVSVIRIEYARYSCEYRIRKASQEYFKVLPSLIFLFLSLTYTVQGVWMCIPQSAVFPLVEPYSTESLYLRPFLREACPYRTTISEEHPLSRLCSIPRRVKTQKHAKTRKHSLSKRNPLM